MFEIGRVCMKIAGRDAGSICVVVEVLENPFVLVDGQTRRRKCNILHLEPLNKIAIIKKGADNKEVVKALKDEGFSVEEKKTEKKTPKQPQTRAPAKSESKKPSKKK